MPRKRTTRAPKKGPRPEVSVIPADIMSEQELHERQDQLNVILQDFDVKVEKIVKKMERDEKQMEIFIRKTFQNAILNLPVGVRKMTVKEYAMSLKDEAAEPVPNRKGFQDRRLEEIRTLTYNGPSESLNIIEEEAPEAKKAQPASNAKGKSTARTAKGKGVKSAMPPPSARQSTRVRSRLQTPVTRLDQWGPTPIITPKVNPNLPITPALVREVKEGEILFSTAGSPAALTRRRAFGAMVDKETVNKCTATFQQETDIQVDLAPEHLSRIFQLITESLED